MSPEEHPLPSAVAWLHDARHPDAAQRRALLEHLCSRFPPEEVSRMAAEAELVSVAAALTHGRPPRRSVLQIAELTGVAPDRIGRLRSAFGLPVGSLEEESIPDHFVEDVRIFEQACALLPEEGVLAFVRVVGASMRRVSEAARALMSASLLEQAGPLPSELEFSQFNEVAMAVYSEVPEVCGRLLRELATRDQDAEVALVEHELNVPSAVAFVDLVGSTGWAQQTPAARLRTALAAFETAAWELATRHGARLVKLIGDEAMFWAPDPEVLCRVALDLCEAAAADLELPLARGAVAFGPVVSRDGDLYGPVVNLASRATKAAESGVIVTAEVSERLDRRAWAAIPAGPVALAGLPEPVPLFRLARR